MYSVKECQQRIEQEIQNQNFHNEPLQLYEPVEYILSIGGKRIRPVFVLMACNLFSDSIEKAILPSLGVEIFHNFTLVHDDIMDQASMRRNHNTVHTKWNTNTGILSGDAMFILAYQYLMKTPETTLIPVLESFNRTALEVCEGQQMDMNFETQLKVKEEEYLRMIELKTSVLLAISLYIGALIGGSSKQDAENLYHYGKNIGLAFQLQDDLLDLYGDAKSFGKTIGQDILTNKKTFLLIKAYERSNEKQKKELDELINMDNSNANKKISAIKNIYDQLDIYAFTKEKIKEYFYSAEKHFNKISISTERKKELNTFVEQILKRTF